MRGTYIERLLEAREWEADMWSRLDEREYEILQLRLGLGGWSKRTLKEVGKELNVTGGRIGQIEAKALRKLREVEIKRRWESSTD